MENIFSKKGLERRIKQHVKSRTHLFFINCQPGFENYLESEITGLGIKNIINKDIGGIEFEGTVEDCYKLSLSLRGASRIIIRLCDFHADNYNKFKKKLKAVSWELYLNPKLKTNYSITCRKSRLNHSGKIGEIISEYFDEYMNIKNFDKDYLKNFDSAGFEQNLIIRFNDDICTISLDAAGKDLYKRGYRVYTGHAPIRESLAFQILQAAEINKYDFLLDPMCGSGTFSAEAFLQAKGLLPGRDKKFSFFQWPVFKKENYEFIKSDLIKSFSKNEKNIEIISSDIDEKSVECANKNFKIMGFDNSAIIKDFFKITQESLPGGEGLIVLNPPYGKRITTGNPGSFYRKIGNHLKKNFKNITIAVIVPGIESEKALGLKYKSKILFMNGGIKTALLIIDI